MPISLTAKQNDEVDLSEWAIDVINRDQVVTILAYLYLRQEQNALRVINAMPKRVRKRTKDVGPNVIEKLTAPKKADLDLAQRGNEEERKSASNRVKNSIWHRDGLLFQHLSWIVAQKKHPNGYMTPPHVRNADKGFDGFIIEFNHDQKSVERVILCEDKATEGPRGMVTSKVWPEIKDIIAQRREDEVEADLTTLLKAVPNLTPEEAEDAVDAIFWERARQFRVSIATDEKFRESGAFDHLFNGFEVVAPGPTNGRIGGILPFESVRQGLHDLAEEVIRKVELLVAESESPYV